MGSLGGEGKALIVRMIMGRQKRTDETKEMRERELSCIPTVIDLDDDAGIYILFDWNQY